MKRSELKKELSSIGAKKHPYELKGSINKGDWQFLVMKLVIKSVGILGTLAAMLIFWNVGDHICVWWILNGFALAILVISSLILIFAQ